MTNNQDDGSEIEVEGLSVSPVAGMGKYDKQLIEALKNSGGNEGIFLEIDVLLNSPGLRKPPPDPDNPTDDDIFLHTRNYVDSNFSCRVGCTRVTL